MNFSQDDDFLNDIKSLCKKENVGNAVFHIIGGVNSAEIVSGPENETLPVRPINSRVSLKSEILGTGTIFLCEGEPTIHLHAAVAKGDDIKLGCIRGETKTFLISEVTMFEILGVEAKRVKDAESGFNLLQVLTKSTT